MSFPTAKSPYVGCRPSPGAVALPPPTGAVAGTRWSAEACFEAAKSKVGLDPHEMRSWTGWRLPITLATFAHAYVAVSRRAAAGELPGPGAAIGVALRLDLPPTPCPNCAAYSGSRLPGINGHAHPGPSNFASGHEGLLPLETAGALIKPGHSARP
jgi:hypothetical protein